MQSATSLVTLTIDTKLRDDVNRTVFLTSEVFGLSAEYFREIRKDGRSLEVTVNDLSSSCVAEKCMFHYSELHTPTIESIHPSSAVPGTELTITGTRFSRVLTMNAVAIGGAECIVADANTTFILCTIPTTSGTAGTFQVDVSVYNMGLASS